MFLLFAELYLFMLFVPAFAGIATGILPNRSLKHISMLLCGISCVAGIISFPLFLNNGTITYTFPIPSAWGEYSILIDNISSLFISLSSVVFLMILIHMLRSDTALQNNRYNALLNVLFISSVLAMCADHVLLILIAWEMVTLATFMMSYSKKNESARWKFFVVAHLGGLMIIAAFITMYVFAGTETLSEWIHIGSSMGLTVSCAVILLLFFGFGTKLGTIPFHAWMPDMYADAPTHTTALMSAISSNIAVLILFRSVFGYIGVEDTMYPVALILFALSSVTALWGALESLIQTEPKRILAYSSMENMALVTLCFSLGMLFTSGPSTELMMIALVAGLFHTINHSIFKPLMLLTVDTVEGSTQETSMERMGGLASVLPALSVFALVAVLSMSAIPPFNGFASEWMMLQSLLGGDIAGAEGMELLFPLGVAVLGICGMMAAVSYARMYGFMFLGRPRSDGAADPKPIKRSAMLPLLILSIFCLLLGILASHMINALADGMNEIASITPSDEYREQLTETLNLPVLAGLLLLIILVVFIVTRIFRKRTVIGETWDCGTDLEDNMQYSSIGFTQPLVRIFHSLYGDKAEIVDDEEENRKKFSVRFTEPFVRYLYEPIGRSVLRISGHVSKIQNGNIQSYFGYILITLVALLLVVGSL